jgi:lysophospholipase L1-like esterase
MSLDQSNFYDLVYHKVKSIIEIHNNLYYLDNVFDQQTGQIWIDFVHINPVGNQLVAHKMLEAIKPLLVNH